MSAVNLVEEPKDPDLVDLYQRLETASGGLGILNIFKVMGHNPKLLRNWLRMATGLLSGGLTLSPRLRELAILRVFQLTGGEYGYSHHVRIAMEAGVAEAELADMSDYDKSGRFSDADRAVLRYTDAVSRLDADAAPQARALRSLLSERDLLELTFCIGHWNMLARILQPLEVPLDESLTAGLPAAWRKWLRA